MFVHRRCYGRTMERSALAWSQSLHQLCSNMQSEDKKPTCTAAVECEFSPSRLTNLNYWTASASHVLMSSSHHCTQLFPSFMSCLFLPIRHLHCFITIMWWVTLIHSDYRQMWPKFNLAKAVWTLQYVHDILQCDCCLSTKLHSSDHHVSEVRQTPWFCISWRRSEQIQVARRAVSVTERQLQTQFNVLLVIQKL